MNNIKKFGIKEFEIIGTYFFEYREETIFVPLYNYYNDGAKYPPVFVIREIFENKIANIIRNTLILNSEWNLHKNR